ncbi:MAG: substrate-binding domain-containing protein [Candidatus Hydrogenedentales bacterium]
MKKAARILAFAFGLVLLGATILNANLVSRSRTALSQGVFRADPDAYGARFHIIVAIPDTDDSYFRGLLEGIRQEVREAEAAVQVFRYAASSEQEAGRCFDLALRARVDGLIMYTSRNDPLEARAAEAQRAGVTFIPVCTDPPTASGQFFVGTDSLRHGFESASIVLGRLGSSARIGIILPSTGSENPENEPFYHGIHSATKVYPGAKIEATVRSRPGALSGEESAASMLRRPSPVNAIICSSARDTVGAAQVVIDMNKVGDVLIVGTDESPDIRRYVDNGVVTASIVRDSAAIGRAAVRAFSARRSGQKALAPLESGFTIYQAAEKNK